MSACQSNSVNPYESPRMEATAAASDDNLPRPGVLEWVATFLIGYQCVATLVSIPAFIYESFHPPLRGGESEFAGAPSPLIVLLVAPIVIAIAALLTYGQFRAIFKKETVWAGRIAVTLFGLGVLWGFFGIYALLSSPSHDEWLVQAVLVAAGPFYPFLLSYVMYRWYRRLKSYSIRAAAKQ